MRLLQVPCRPHADSLAYLRGEKRTAPAQWVEELRRDDKRSVENALKLTLPDADRRENWDYLEPRDVSVDIARVRSVDNTELKHINFDALGSNHYGSGGSTVKNTENYISFLRWHMATTSGSVYGGHAVVEKTREELDRGKDSFQMEHATPQSWTGLVTLLDIFRYVVSDPTTVFVAWGLTNQQRGNKAIGFSKGPSVDGTYRPWRSDGSYMASCVARAVIHSTMTYPLLSNQHNVLRLEYARTSIHEYSAQIDVIVALAQQTPQPWETEIAMQTYSRFGCLNPLSVSSRCREQFADSTSPFYKQLKKRWSGSDGTSAMLLRAVRQLATESCD